MHCEFPTLVGYAAQPHLDRALLAAIIQTDSRTGLLDTGS
jgi:hypothetical protein